MLSGQAQADYLSRSKGGVPEALSACPTTANCVTSQGTTSDLVHYIRPFSLRGSSSISFSKLKSLIEAHPRAHIVKSTPVYIQAEFTTKILRFIDDVEFLYDEAAQVIQVRSASRIGYSDMGANRRRIKALRQDYAN